MRLTWLVFVVAWEDWARGKKMVRNRDTGLSGSKNLFRIYIIVQCKENKHATGQEQIKSATVHGTSPRGLRVEQQNRNRKKE